MERKPGTFAYAEADDSKFLQVIDETGSVHEFVVFTDASGQPVTGLRTTFRLRALDNSATFGVARGDEIGGPGNYWALIPAYRWEPDSNAYETIKPYMQTAAGFVSLTVTIAGSYVTIPIRAALGIYAASASVPSVVDCVFDGEFRSVPHPTALGQDVGYFEVRVSANDRKNTTVLTPISYEDLYEKYVETGEFLDLGTVTVESELESVPIKYRLYLLPRIGPGQLEVLPAASEWEGLALCKFDGGGNDCSIEAKLEPISEHYATKKEAVLSICSEVRELKILPLGVGPAAYFGDDEVNAPSRFLSYEVYYILKTCVD
ncbi:MAG: hypothetical protein KAY37_02475 [Phycisphaerae bacterium]|nr:hypothetical protein [Phycisphaerae bacterium]